MPVAESSPAVCVTGAGGYIASWIVKSLLERGYTVKGTVRNPGLFFFYITLIRIYFLKVSQFIEYYWDLVFVADDPKNTHLRELEGAKERLILCKADLQDYEALKAAICGCDGVFHTASPVTDDPVSIFAERKIE